MDRVGITDQNGPVSGNRGREGVIGGGKKDEIGGGRSIEGRGKREEGNLRFEFLDLEHESLLFLVGLAEALFAASSVFGFVVFVARETPHHRHVFLLLLFPSVVVIVDVATITTTIIKPSHWPIHWAPPRWHSQLIDRSNS